MLWIKLDVPKWISSFLFADNWAFSFPENAQSAILPSKKNSKFLLELQPLYIIHKEYPVKTGKIIANLYTTTEKEIFSRLYV